uniref:Uncharacterized protein n=1 Tax=Rhizophora mucronata TaxID=61149 RepID=A0A2P2J5P6_RHIMU
MTLASNTEKESIIRIFVAVHNFVVGVKNIHFDRLAPIMPSMPVDLGQFIAYQDASYCLLL